MLLSSCTGTRQCHGFPRVSMYSLLAVRTGTLTISDIYSGRRTASALTTSELTWREGLVLVMQGCSTEVMELSLRDLPATAGTCPPFASWPPTDPVVL